LRRALALTEGAALGAALRIYVRTAAAHTDTLGLALTVVIISAVVGLTVNSGLRRGTVARDRVAAALGSGLIGLAAGLVALAGGRAVHMDAGQAAEVFLVVPAGGHLAFQRVFHNASLAL